MLSTVFSLKFTKRIHLINKFGDMPFFNYMLITMFTFVIAIQITAADSQSPPLDSFILKNNDFIDIQKMDSSILVHLVYATSENFMKKNIYGNFTRCFLRREAAQMLSTAQMLLGKRRPGYLLSPTLASYLLRIFLTLL
ncbi:MAG: hypothetical protein JW915_07555 [Chitinispirillaceae bacterium]|nr:hypothetical protein [Chitinispirillaceae bacterium]